MNQFPFQDNDEKYQMYTDKWVERFIRLGLWDSVLPDNYELWLDNFDLDGQTTARCLIDGLVYYNQRDVSNIINWCFDKCIRNLCYRSMPSLCHDLITGDSSIPEKWESIKKNVLSSLFVCPAFTDKPDASSYIVYRSLTATNPLITDDMKCELNEVKDLAKAEKCKTLVLVDDIVGSGRQALKNWYETDKFVSSVSEPLAKSAEEHGINCFLLVVVGCYDGLKQIRDKTKLHLIAGEEIPPYLSILNPRFWPNRDLDYTKIVKQIAKEKCIPVRGFKNKSWAIAFDHDIPNVSTPLFYFNNQSWNPLYVKPKKG